MNSSTLRESVAALQATIPSLKQRRELDSLANDVYEAVDDWCHFGPFAVHERPLRLPGQPSPKADNSGFADRVFVKGFVDEPGALGKQNHAKFQSWFAFVKVSAPSADGNANFETKF